MNKEAEKLYNSITNIREEFIEEAHNSRAKKPGSVWVKRLAFAACLCLMLASAFALLGGSEAPDGIEVPERDPAEESQAAQKQAPENSSFFAIDSPYNQIIDPKTMISSYGDGGSSACYKSPDNGAVIYSVPLKGAMEEYGDSVLYRVVVDVFTDNEQLKPNSETVKGEQERLGDLGYTVAFEEYYDGEVSHYYFTLHASCEELENFPASGSFGYMLWLYDERAK